ncbi:MAG: DarT ssDNA thymidine ADP-ribosyltransferase family protein [Methylococcaceae bacterium]
MENTVKNRGIRVAFHFTRLENLDSILESGIVPRQTLKTNSKNFSYNDESRFDNHTDASCFSLGHPNYKMFYKLRRMHPEQEWIVIGCRPEILWIKNCAFCVENAASDSVRFIPIEQRKGTAAFEKMFFSDEIHSREELKLSNDYPTNPQAEVLVFDVVERSHIFFVCCQSKYMAGVLKEKYPDIDFFVHHEPFFSARTDHLHWKKHG